MKINDNMIDLFCDIRDRNEMKKLFAEFFTPAEIDDFVLRWKLLSALAEGKTQREIAKDLHISLCKITRGSKLLKQKNSIMQRTFIKE
ncbi:MAG TPA: Trp family transcriptional regulator [Spirochaetota bacterium]|nr:Trp family transcriptional regulator [Spirochaetota bacterium]